MVAASSGSRGKPAKFVKKGTETTKTHRFEPFSQRIARLKIDPIHRVRRPSFGDEDGDEETFSHFRSSLEHWAELNLTENFVQFVRRVNPLSESLAQILYHEGKIMGLLVEYIDKRDQLSMEPLLSLLAQFARDLGVRFEKYFASAVTLVASIAASHADVEVVEWSFTCLAWIFKFLSRLLVPDLTPVLNIMSPYLGKERQKPFVARFAAESMSFLIRKAGLVYYKNKLPLERAVSFLFKDLRETEDSRCVDSYKEGLMVMFSDAIKGVKGGIHSNGADILRCLLDSLSSKNELQSELAQQVLSGIVTNIMHHTSSDTFEPLLDTIESHITTDDYMNTPFHAQLCTRLSFLCVNTRQGSRVKNWKGIHRSLITLLQSALRSPETFQDCLSELLTAASFSLQLSPMDEMLPSLRQIMDAITDERLSKHFLSFCATFAEAGSERFRGFILPYFQKFVTSLWQDYEYELCHTLFQLNEAGCVTAEVSRPGYITCPPAWKKHITEKFNKPQSSLDEVSLLYAYSKLPGVISFSTEPSILPQLVQSLHGMLLSSLGPDSPYPQPLNDFACGQGFKTYVDLASQSSAIDEVLWDPIIRAAPRFSRLSLFLEATLSYMLTQNGPIDVDESALEPLASALITNLAGPSHELRLVSLKILRELVTRALRGDASLISTAIEIEESPLNLQTARYLSMQVRKLALAYPQIISHRWLPKLIPYFCFGLFSKKLAPLWDDSAEALKTMSEQAVGESIISDMAIGWLQEHGSSPATADQDDDTYFRATEFECFNVLKIEKLINSTFQQPEEATAILLQEFEQRHHPSPITPTWPRSHALRVLNAAPQIAEKRSRQIVPMFLSWASHDEDSPVTPEGSGLTPDQTQPHWGFKDRMALLALFGKFINPKVLYKASEVQSALLTLLANGDSEIQKSALKALFTWKSPHIIPYQENLLNILDESRFREELAVFVRVGGDDSVIEEEHRTELLPVLLRLLYGRMVSRVAQHGGQGGQTGRRKAILRTLSQLSDKDFDLFVRIAFGALGDHHLVEDGQVQEQQLASEIVSPRKQMGLLRMIETMFDTLKSRMLPYTERSMDVVVYCLVRACRALKDDPTVDGADSQAGSQVNVSRGIRQLAIRCLDLIFSVSPDTDWSYYLATIFDEAINPRLDNFAIETAQGISGLLRLFHTWASAPKSAFYLVRYNKGLLDNIVDCLGVESARDEVKIFVMDEILVPLIGLSTGKSVDEKEEMGDVPPEQIRSEVLAPYVEPTLSHLGNLLKHNPSRPLMVSGVETLSLLAPCVESSRETSSLISIATFLLRQPPDRVSPKTKSGLLRILKHFLPLYNHQENGALTTEVFDAISSMFDYFKDDQNRELLSNVFAAFASHDSELQDVASLCSDLNAVSTQRLDEVDYGRRLQAFTQINDDLWSSFNAKQWRPLLYNMLYHIKDEDELAIRSSASYGLRRFVERAANAAAEFDSLIMTVLLPTLRNGVKHKAEMIRAEFVSSLGYFIKWNPTLPAVQDMHVLLVGDDEEASFFNNILHIQQHRRMRALRRLAGEAAKGKIQASNISTIFMPLIEHYIFDQAEDENAHNLTAEAVNTIGTLGEWLEWPQFRAIFRRYRAYMESKSETEKNVIRLLGRMADALTHAMNQARAPQDVDDTSGMEDVEPSVPSKTTLARTLPADTKLAAELTSHFIPFLTKYIHHKDEAEVSLRLPVAVTTVKLIKLLPEEDQIIRLPAVLLDVCNVLRSRAQESRDIARRTLAEIALILGPSHFGYILRELRSALTRGYQLHVLSFTLHSILVTTTDDFKQGDLDHCLGEMVSVVMDDIFGTTGQEKEAEEYISKMKEVKSSKSYDSMELLAKISTVRHLAHLIRPLQGLLREKLTLHIVKKVDELLRRIGVGLLRNPGAESRDLLVFCYEVIKESYEDPKTTASESAIPASRLRFLVNLPAKRGEKLGSTTSYAYKLARFSLDVLRSILNKYNSLLTASNVAGFLPMIGDFLVDAHEEVKISSLRLLSTIVKLPLPDLDKNSHVYLTEAVKLIKEAPSTNTEAAHASLKLIAAMLRERKATKLKDGHLAFLLKRLASDIEEPDRQGVTFNFIRAVMARKFVVPEMYELMDGIATMMVTNQTRSARDLARGVYVHFLLEYPQAKNRWAKQLAFLAKNFDFQYREGRQSVMEAVHMLLAKTGDELAQDIVGTFFLPVVMVMANDDSPECREMAGVLLGELYRRADRKQISTILRPLHSWLEQTDNMLLTSTGLQAMRIFFDPEVTEKDKEARFVIDVLPTIIEPIVESQNSENWEVLYFALQLFSKLCKTVPSISLTQECAPIWSLVRESLFFPHAWVKTCAANLVGLWLADLAKANAASGYGAIPLVGSSGLKLDKEAMLQLIRASTRCLRTPGISEELAMQTVRNIIFLGRCFAQNKLEFSKAGPRETEADEAVDESDSGEEDEDNNANNTDRPVKSAIQYIFQQVSLILRRETLSTKAESLIPKTACMGLLAALCRHLDTEQIMPSLAVILLPLQHLTDQSIPAPRSSDRDFQEVYKALVSNAHEVLDLLQKKLGTTEYVAQMTRVQESIKERREGRRVKRRIEAVADPEKVGREKKRRNERKREKRKEKGLEFRGKRRGW
ncbi:HEAT repeat protein (DRIM), putative [Paecilomyces variotii No. 5]|uniref:HEAT repeat protein (DRIM), putative n=1 Tax=Byssochlamys spectabilis (strain No. 5 / NBRC 109023) TaxID=1356009 RepID=V5FVB5_BYSSN|nr:HEAT repeat protein (DRIM), putative [Paecilomyces variotii No. 5]